MNGMIKSQSICAGSENGLSDAEIRSALERSLEGCSGMRRVLLLPPDYTRLHSNAGRIVQHLWEILSPECQVDVLPALGTHVPMTQDEWRAMYGEVPFDRMLVHNWRTDVETLGTVPEEVIDRLSGGLMRRSAAVQINRRLLDPGYDLILSIGQVVPHEVVGMANRNKNLFVGCGGAEFINASHMLGAFCGLESIMGRDHTPVRRLFDYAEAHFLGGEKCEPIAGLPEPEIVRSAAIPLSYILTVTTALGGRIRTHGLFIGRERARFEDAVALAQKKNLTLVDRPFRKAVVWLDEREFRSTWLGNKAVYRTRMAMADGGELLILAPGVERFGEDPAIDFLIRKYGYCGRDRILQLVREQADLRENLSAAAHLIHGSDDGRFRITYCTQHLSEAEIRGVHYDYHPFADAAKRYNPDVLRDGWNVLSDGEEVFFVSNPALGLWADRRRF